MPVMPPREEQREQVFESRSIPTINVPSSPNQSSQSPTRSAFPSPSQTIFVDYHELFNNDLLSPAQRDLLGRVANASERIAEWTDHLGRWPCPGSFPLEINNDQWPLLPYFDLVQSENFLNHVHQELKNMDIDDIKGRVLSIHQGNSRPTSSASSFSFTKFAYLDEFTYYVTKILLNLLPRLVRLKELLNCWSMRLIVLSIVPQFFEFLLMSENLLELLWEKLQTRIIVDEDSLQMQQQQLHEVRQSTAATIALTGQFLDNMLDSTEGYDDSLPEHWIDRFESVEKEFGIWAAASEQIILFTRHRLMSMKAGIEICAVKLQASDQGSIQNSATAQAAATTSESTILPGFPESPDYEQIDSPLVSCSSSNSLPSDSSHLREESPSNMNHAFPAHSILTPQKSVSSEKLVNLLSETPSVIEENTDDSELEVDSLSRPRDGSPKPPLNAQMKKRRDKPLLNIIADDDDSNIIEPEDIPLPSIEPEDSSLPSIVEFSSSPLHSTHSNFLSLQDQLSSILSSLPTPIRLRSGPAPNAPEFKPRKYPSSKASTLQASTRDPKNVPRRSVTPAFTLTPAVVEDHSSNLSSTSSSTTTTTSSSSSRRKINEPDVRLYHLIQTGRDKPIKLFIRRIGKRVMVRVGGGWADLAEYLRGYAEHHMRAASENKDTLAGEIGADSHSSGGIEIQPLVIGVAIPSVSTSSPSNKSRLPSATTTTTNLSTSRSGSIYNRSRSGTPAPTFERDVRSPTPDVYTSPAAQNTFRSSGSRATSFSSVRLTPDDSTATPASLAGPYAASRRAEHSLSDSQQEWVDGIVAQAQRKISASGTGVDVGALGKIGATKRIFLKGGAISSAIASAMMTAQGRNITTPPLPPSIHDANVSGELKEESETEKINVSTSL